MQPIFYPHDFLKTLFLWRFAIGVIDTAFEPGRRDLQVAPVDESVAVTLRARLRRLANWLLLAGIAASFVRHGELTAWPLMLSFVVVELLAMRSLHGSLREDRLAALQVAPGAAMMARQWRMVVRIAALTMVGLGGLGFVNLAWYVGWSVLRTTMLLGVAIVLWRLGTGLTQEWGRSFPHRTQVAITRFWTVLVVIGVVLLFPAVWDVEGAVLRVVGKVMAAGVQLGDRRINVLRVSVAAAWVLLAWFVGRMIAGLLERRVFPRTPLDVGVRTAILVSTNYLVIAAGVLAAIKTLGYGLTNLAILVGGLGVGVGLGLQSLVSNFVSGLIILFERPFKLGDILEHEGVLGYVRKIRTRSTVVRTFDEAELVFPNAGLLAEKITNWTMTDNRCRTVIKVGVAYGSDVVKVRDTLYRVAKQHGRVLDDPRVYFTGFGDSALEFRLMVWVDIRERLDVVSDLHFAIDAAFREAGIQIPFPQRDVHLVTQPESK